MILKLKMYKEEEMQYFTEQAGSHQEVNEKVKEKYGESARILTRRTVRMGGFLGLFSREGVEVTGYISPDAGKKRLLDLEAEKKKILSTVKNDQTLQKVLEEVQSLKETLNRTPSGSQEKHQTIEKIETLLIENDFDREFIAGILDRIKKDLTLEDLDNFSFVQDTVLVWIGESIGIFQGSPKIKPRIFILVGPTGVGKTTTIAKLAAMHGLGTNGEPAKNVRMLTIDNYRIGARKQIETYGEIMGIPVHCVETCQDLKKRIALFDDADLILIDTIGKSPREYMKLAEMREILDACGETAETHLAISATTKTSDIKEILQQFEPFKYRSVILTKLDETMRLGNILSILAEKRKPLSYITDGQMVPQDIEKASVSRLLTNLEGFKIDKTRLERKFGNSPAVVSGSTEREWNRT